MPGRKITVFVASVATLMATAVVIAPTADAKPKAKAPAKVTKVRVSAVTTNAATISWKNPKSKNFKATIVRIAAGTKAPKTIKAGGAVAKVSKKKHAVRVVRLKPNTLYTVSIFSSGGGKLASKPVTVRIRTKAVPRPTTPSTPVKRAPAAVSNVVVNIVDGVAKLSWTPPTDQSNFGGVKIFRTATAGLSTMARRAKAATPIADVPKGKNDYDDTTIQAGSTYSYSIQSTDAAGNAASASAQPATPTVTKAGALPVDDVTASGGDKSVDVYWDVDPQDENYAGAKIVRREVDGDDKPIGAGKVLATVPEDDGTYYYDDDSALVSGVTYSYTVYALNADGIAADGVSDLATVDEAAVKSISGVVTASDSTPLKDVEVQVYEGSGDNDQDGYADESIDTEYTDESGQYAIENLPDGNYTVCFNAQGVSGGPSASGYLSQCFDGESWSPNAVPSVDAEAVSVTNGVHAGNVDASLDAGTSVQGTVTSGSSKVEDAYAYLIDRNDPDRGSVIGVSTASNGEYRLLGVPAGDYVVCVDAATATGGSARAGFLGQCFDEVAWDPRTEAVPFEGVTVVASSADATRRTDFDLEPASGVEGSVTSAAGPLVGASVTVFDTYDTEKRYTAQTASDGTFTVPGLVPGTYTVCATGDFVDDLPTGGYQAQCLGNKAWLDRYAPASGVDTVSTETGSLAPAGDVTLPRGGAITGSVQQASSANAPVNGTITVFDEGQIVTTAYSYAEDNGVYVVNGLAAGTSYQVCFEGSSTDPDSDTVYVAECWENAPWDGGISTPTSATTPVAVTVGQATPSIDGTLLTAGSITGTVTSGGAPVAAYVLLIDDEGEVVYSDQTDGTGDGAYRLIAAPGVDYHVCFKSSEGSFESQCFDNVGWNGDQTAPSGAVLTLGDGEQRQNVDARLLPIV